MRPPRAVTVAGLLAAYAIAIPFSTALAQDTGTTASRPFVFFTPGFAIWNRDTSHDAFFDSLDTTVVVPFSRHVSSVSTFSLQFRDKARWTSVGNYDWFFGRSLTVRASAGLIDDALGVRATIFQQRKHYGMGLRVGMVAGDFEVGAFASAPLAVGVLFRNESMARRLKHCTRVADLGAATALGFSFRDGLPDVSTEPLYFFPRDTNWARMGHGPQGRSATLATLQPALYQLWAAQTGGPVRSSAAIVANTVYVASDDGYFYALNLENGALRWRYRLGGTVSSSPAVADDKVFVGTDEGAIYCLKSEGTKRLAEEKVGTQLWRYRTGGAVAGCPLHTVSGLVIVGSRDGKVYAVKATTGELAWSYQTNGPVTASPVRSEAEVSVAKRGARRANQRDIIYCASEDGSLYAFDEREGKLLWRVTTGAPVVANPLVCGRLVVAGNSAGRVVALRAGSGLEAWSQALGGEIRGSLTLARGRLLVPLVSGDLIGLGTGKGEISWKAKLPGGVASTPAAVSGRTVFVTSVDGHLYSVDRRSGRVVWSLATGGPVSSSPAVAHGMLVFGSGDGVVYGLTDHLEGGAGAQVQKHPVGGPATPSPTPGPESGAEQPTLPPPLAPEKPAATPPPGGPEAQPPAKTAEERTAELPAGDIEMTLVSEPADDAQLPIQLTTTLSPVLTWGTTEPTAEVDGEAVRPQDGRIAVTRSYPADGTYPVMLVTGKGTPGERTTCRLLVVDTSEEPAASRTVSFSPDGDGRGDTIALRVAAKSLSKQPVAVRIVDIRRPSGEAVRTWSAVGEGEGTFIWDGKDLAGKPVPSGEYVIVYTIRDAAGQIRRMKQAVLVQRAGERLAAG